MHLRPKKTVPIALAALIIIGVAITVATAALLQTKQNTQNIPTQGSNGGSSLNSVNIGVYSDAAATINCSSIDWGKLIKGNSVNRIVYIKNSGNAIETLNMTLTGWNPTTANSVLSLSWDKEGISIYPGEVILATITLRAAADTGTLSFFNFNILISGNS